MSEGSNDQQEQKQDQGKEPFEIRIEVSAKGIRSHYPKARILEVLGAMNIAETVMIQEALGGNKPQPSSLVLPSGGIRPPRM